MDRITKRVQDGKMYKIRQDEMMFLLGVLSYLSFHPMNTAQTKG
jgi:hypothetical protein